METVKAHLLRLSLFLHVLSPLEHDLCEVASHVTYLGCYDVVACVQVLVKYNRTQHLETLNWHNKDTGARVVVPINTETSPGAPPRSGPPSVSGAARPDGTPSRPAATMAAPASAAPDGSPADPISAAAQAARLQQALPYGLAPRVNILSNMNFNWQVYISQCLKDLRLPVPVPAISCWDITTIVYNSGMTTATA